MYYLYTRATIIRIVGCALLILSFEGALSAQETSQPSWPEPVDADRAGLENMWRVSERVYSGGQPQSPDSFRYLATLGIKVIVSVDGIKPDIDAASSAGLRYVHIPIGYDSIPLAAQRQMMTVSSQISGNIYVHCHHGKHRGPSAAAVLCMFEDDRPRDTALEILRRAGTAKQYAGLWKSVSQFDKQRVAAEPPAQLVSIAKVPPTASTMVAINRHFTELEKLTDAEHTKPKSIGELALLSSELLLELSRTSSSDVDEDLLDGYRDASKLYKELEQLAHQSRDRPSVSSLKKQLSAIGDNCQACHRQHRN